MYAGLEALELVVLRETLLERLLDLRFLSFVKHLHAFVQ